MQSLQEADHIVIIVGKKCARNIEKFINLANVVCVSEYIGGYVYYWFFR